MSDTEKRPAISSDAGEEAVERQLGELGAQQKNIRTRLAALATDSLETREMITKLDGSVTSLDRNTTTLFELVCERMESLDRSSNALLDLVCERIEDHPAGTRSSTSPWSRATSTNSPTAATATDEKRTPPDSMPDAAREGGDRAANAATEEAGGEPEGKSGPGGKDDEEAQVATTIEPEDKSDPGEEDVKQMEGTTTPQDEAAAETSEEGKQPQARVEGAGDTPPDGEAGADAIPESTDPPPSANRKGTRRPGPCGAVEAREEDSPPIDDDRAAAQAQALAGAHAAGCHCRPRRDPDSPD